MSDPPGSAVIDQHGRLLADAEFGAHSDGYRQLLGWLRRHGQLSSVGVEGTGTYGTGLTRFLLDYGVQVLEADRSATSRPAQSKRPGPGPASRTWRAKVVQPAAAR